MPIANCIVAKKYLKESDSSCDLIEKWGAESKISPEHMTINIISNEQQHGNRYGIMANLFLPTIWSTKDVSLLQIGLAKSLASYFSVDIKEIHVITALVDSGLVVENGEEQQW